MKSAVLLKTDELVQDNVKPSANPEHEWEVRRARIAKAAEAAVDSANDFGNFVEKYKLSDFA